METLTEILELGTIELGSIVSDNCYGRPKREMVVLTTKLITFFVVIVARGLDFAHLVK